MRLINGFIAFLCVIIGGFLSGYVNRNIFLLGIVVFFCVIGGNLINDFFDLEIDRINRPKKVFFWERFGKKRLLLLSLIFFLIGNIISYFVGYFYFFITLTATVLLILYTPFFKPLPLLGNILVSGISGFTFVLGAIAGGNVKSSLFPFLFAFFIHLPREILKDVEDIEGDKKMGLKTFPIIFGEKNALILAYLFTFLLLFISFFSIFYYNIYFKISMILLFHIPLVFFFFTTSKMKEIRSKSVYLEKSLKKLMFTGLIILFTGGIKC